MKVERIGYSESVEAVNSSGNKKWFKASMDVIEVEDNVARATALVTEYVEETIANALKKNSSYVVDITTLNQDVQIESSSEETDLEQDHPLSKIHQEEIELIKKLTVCKTIEELQEYENWKELTPTISMIYTNKLRKFTKQTA
jgi:hypothetical protein